MTCDQCKHSRLVGQGQWRCTRFPPVPMIGGMTDQGPAILSAFPTVQPLMSCGEFVSVKDAPAVLTP